MEQAQINQNHDHCYKHSWVAYIRPTLIFLFVSFLSLTFVLGSGSSESTHLIGSLFLLLSVAYIILKTLSIRSMKLYTDNEGVWIYSGILPWTKGVRGVKWRDIEDGIYFTNFLSWALKSYTVRVGHRFTKSSEIIVSHVKHGNEAVRNINDKHGEVLSESTE